MKKKVLFTALIFSIFLKPVFAIDNGENAFVDGLSAYSKGDWTSSIFSLKQASFYEAYNTPETMYMLINAELFSGDIQSAMDSCEIYLQTFPDSLYEGYIMYLKGRCSYLLGEYDKAVIVLSDFCHEYPTHEMYAAALFWIAESFYSCYQYDDAVSLYNRIVLEYPADPKSPSAQYRIETIKQREREEKLLYLLKQTGEEYLIAREEYEKQLRIYSTESAYTTRKRLVEEQEKNRELEKSLKKMEVELSDAKNGTEIIDKELLRQLKEKAKEAKKLLNN